MKRFSNEIGIVNSTDGTSLLLSNLILEILVLKFLHRCEQKFRREIRNNVQKCEADIKYHFLHTIFNLKNNLLQFSSNYRYEKCSLFYIFMRFLSPYFSMAYTFNINHNKTEQTQFD